MYVNVLCTYNNMSYVVKFGLYAIVYVGSLGVMCATKIELEDCTRTACHWIISQNTIATGTKSYII